MKPRKSICFVIEVGFPDKPVSAFLIEILGGKVSLRNIQSKTDAAGKAIWSDSSSS